MGSLSDDMEREMAIDRHESTEMFVTRYVLQKHLSTSDDDTLTTAEVGAGVQEFVVNFPTVFTTSAIVNDVINIIKRGGRYIVVD